MRSPDSGYEALRLPDWEIERLLADDLQFGDLTTRVLAIGGMPGRMIFAARQPIVVSGSEEAQRLLTHLGARVTYAAAPGEHVAKGSLLLDVEGPAGALHAGWKVAQTLMEWASGIATLTAEIVSAAKARAPRIEVLCTRKSVPFTRPLSLKAVIAGGAEVHRLGLSDTIMLFPEHRVFLDAGGGLKTVIAALKARAPERSVMVEVTSELEAIDAADAMADVIQLEKFVPEAVSRVVKRVRKRADGRPIIAAAGGINAQNTGDYADTGADTLITSAPFYARPLDIQVSIGPLAQAAVYGRESLM